MKTPLLAVTCLLLALNSSAQNYDYDPGYEPPSGNPLIEIAHIAGEAQTWDFSGITLGNYPNTTDSDLVPHVNTEQLYKEIGFKGLGESQGVLLEDTIITQDTLSFVRKGYVEILYEGTGQLFIPGAGYDEVDKLSFTEKYDLMYGENVLISYQNTYYEFFQVANQKRVFSVFEKQRRFKGNIGQDFNGCAYYQGMPNPQLFNEENLQISLTPNPATEGTTLSFQLISVADVKVELLNQSGNVNVVISELTHRDAGYNQVQFALDAYDPGSYTVKLTVNNVSFTRTLIIN